MNITLRIEDEVSQRLGRFREDLENAADLNADLGRRLANDLREHFRLRNVNGPRNKLGAPSSGFWSEIRDSVNDGEITGSGVEVTISDPRFVQKYYGGEIRADDKLLAIPARTEAYGKSPRLFPFLRAIFFRSGVGALVEGKRPTQDRRGRKQETTAKTEGLVWYWLKESVHQDEDPEALPSRTLLEAGLADTTEKHINRKIADA